MAFVEIRAELNEGESAPRRAALDSTVRSADIAVECAFLRTYVLTYSRD